MNVIKRCLRVGTFFAFLITSHAWASEDLICDESCTFVLKSERESKFTVINQSRADTRLSPFSTFKIPNTLIALDLGVVSSLNQELTYDHEKYPAQRWWPTVWYEKPLPIRAAFQNSAVPIYQQIAFQVGVERMNQYLTRFNYGNMDISSGVDRFWLDGSLKISAREQVNFLHKLFSGQLPVSSDTLVSFKKIMLVEETDKYKFYAKTGGGQTSKGYALGWYIGIVESKDNVHYFALNMDGDTFGEVQKNRVKMAKQQLIKLGIL
ncbi:beta-lactamase OXA-10 [Microbulbifer sp. NBRC 101763]|uniref:penicillin-binding transpeptidase domain-containing protein n=1 Tax=Microbulbifer TaxID=48073 RepID=UPI0003750799|nr:MULTISPECIES: penicillin-binding transpeptidase domain-containing protein [Microbulbifer]WHI49297.1 penicillin-binding transpeptidase domain-containing protein [Microbulbifer sp. MLAF003]